MRRGKFSKGFLFLVAVLGLPVGALLAYLSPLLPNFVVFTLLLAFSAALVVITASVRMGREEDGDRKDVRNVAALVPLEGALDAIEGVAQGEKATAAAEKVKRSRPKRRKRP